MSRELKAAFLALASSLGLLGATFAAARFLQPPAFKNPDFQAAANFPDPAAALQGDALHGYELFDRNCADCHGEDARGGDPNGDNGPNLYDSLKTDARIARIIMRGIKGEMPRFDKKLTDADARALVAYLRTLKD
jgi:mono/diheme cytochrome c family protein